MLRMTLLLGLCLYLTSNSFGQVVLQLAERENKTYISMLDENPSNYVEDTLERNSYGIKCIFNCIIVNNFDDETGDVNGFGTDYGNVNENVDVNENGDGSEDVNIGNDITTITLPYLRPSATPSSVGTQSDYCKISKRHTMCKYKV